VRSVQSEGRDRSGPSSSLLAAASLAERASRRASSWGQLGPQGFIFGSKRGECRIGRVDGLAAAGDEIDLLDLEAMRETSESRCWRSKSRFERWTGRGGRVRPGAGGLQIRLRRERSRATISSRKAAIAASSAWSADLAGFEGGEIGGQSGSRRVSGRGRSGSIIGGLVVNPLNETLGSGRIELFGEGEWTFRRPKRGRDRLAGSRGRRREGGPGRLAAGRCT
jgi:hypothetical protein